MHLQQLAIAFSQALRGLCHLMTPKCVGLKALPIIFENVLKYEKKSEKIQNVKNRHCLRPKKPFQGSKNFVCFIQLHKM